MNKLDDKFGAWLKVVLPDSGTAERNERLAVIRKFAGIISKENILELVLAFYSTSTDNRISERLRSEMRNVDTSFGPKMMQNSLSLPAGYSSRSLKTEASSQPRPPSRSSALTSGHSLTMITLQSL
jgi:hypothetical protein